MTKVRAFQWADALRVTKQRRLTLCRPAAGLAVGSACLVMTIASPPRPLLVWNASASAPVGLYAVAPPTRIRVGDMVIAWPPEAARRLGAERHYIPFNVPLVKRVAAAPGDRVCTLGRNLLINGSIVAQRLAADAHGRRMLWWNGCITLRDDDATPDGQSSIIRRALFRANRHGPHHRQSASSVAALKTFATALATLIATPADTRPAADPVVRWRPILAEASRRFGVPEAWIVAVMRVESRGQTMLGGRPITSRAGAIGLMQLMPATYAEMRRRLGLGADPYNPHDNIEAGTFYLRLMYERFGYPGLFAAYNAGPGRYAAHLVSGRPLPGETRIYLAMLAQTSPLPAMPPAILSGERLFFRLSETEKPVDRQADQNGIFVDLSAGPGPK